MTITHQTKTSQIMKRNLGIIIALLLTLQISAQALWREKTDTISQAGYYHIEISQELAGLGLHSLKLVDDHEKETPYFIRSSIPVRELTQLEMYPLQSNTAKDSMNVLVVKNSSKETISRFYLSIEEAEVVKHITLRGSYDGKQWFSVKQRSILHSEQNTTLGSISIIDFPTGSYDFYEITLTNNSKSPLNVKGVGRIKSDHSYGEFVELNVNRFTVEENDKKQTIISFPQMKFPYYLYKMEWEIAENKHYKRYAYLMQEDTSSGQFILSSRNKNIVYWDKVQITHNSKIVIDNQDNPPLTIQSVKLFGLAHYLCSYLEAGRQYTVQTGNESYKRYDIQDFSKEIPAQLPVVKTHSLEKKAVEKAVVPEEKPTELFFEKPLFLWTVMIITGIILVFICVRMLNELKKKDS